MSVTGLPWVARDSVERVRYRARRTAFIARLRVHAFWQRATVELDVARNVKLGKDVRAKLTARTHNVLRIGPSSMIGDRTLFVLGGGRIELADWVDIRRDAVLNVAGRLTIGGRNLIQPGLSIHCDEAITVGRMAGLGERVSLIDSAHFFTGPDDAFVDNMKTGPIEIGYNAWLGAKATVGRNVRIGDHCVVGANSMVVRDAPAGHLVSGVPADTVRRIVPWLDE